MDVKCNKCGHVGAETEFPKERDFLQNRYISGCPKCDNRQSPGNASLRMFPGTKHPFSFIRRKLPDNTDAFTKTMYEAEEAS
jgi:hypothetical protein